MFGKRAAKKAAAEPVVELTPFQKAAQERAEMKPFENSQYWVCGDYAMHYRIDKAAGKEKGKFFLLHGFWMNTMFYDELVEKLNAEGYTVYRVDMPSFGYSTRETKGIDYVRPADVIAKMIADLDDGKGFILYGHSMGGSVAMEVALLAPKHVKALILNAPMFMRNSNDKQAERFLEPRMVSLLTTEAKLIQKLNRAIKLFVYVMTWDKDYAKSFDAKRFTAPFADPDAGESLGFFTGHVKKPDVKTLKDIKAPVQYVAGGRDLFVNKGAAKKIRKALPKGTDCRVIKGAGHCFPQAQTDLAVEYMKEFLK
ncbi:MAG: alpha/beta hydrolase [Acutalibacteraceae bacterium]|nr:alpha/beta hydrolase [Acutalibacteraceae bacterium]MEE3311777.1 alpha/beta hydrolase [Acutalibacteraceae bacterium]